MHEVVAEAAVNQRCVDAAGGHWDVPQSLCVDVASRRSRKDGVQYRVGVHRSAEAVQSTAAGPNNPHPHVVSTVAQAGVQLAHSLNVWKRPSRQTHVLEPEEATSGRKRHARKPYGAVLQCPRVAVDYTVGAFLRLPLDELNPTSSAELWSGVQQHVQSHPFASVGMTAQLGSFTRPLLDFSRVRG